METILFAVLFLFAYLIVVHWLFNPRGQGLELQEVATKTSLVAKNTETLSQAMATSEEVETSNQRQQDYIVDDTTKQILETAQPPKFELNESDSFESFETSQPLPETMEIPNTIVEERENSKISETILPTSQYLELSENSCQPEEQSVIHQAFIKTLEDFRKLTFLISQGKSATSENHLVSK